MADNLIRMRAAVASARVSPNSDAPLCVLDLGCGDGAKTWTFVPAGSSVFGVELSQGAARAALGRTIRVVAGDLNGGLPFRSHSFDVVTSNQVVEHLYDTDAFISESYRVLRPGGLIVVSTENLSSWHNIGALVLGWQAFSLTNVSQKSAGLGNPIANLRGTEPMEKGWEHLRIFAPRGLLELVRAHGFVEARILGAGYYPLPSRTARLDYSHAAFITVMATRP